MSESIIALLRDWTKRRNRELQKAAQFERAGDKGNELMARVRVDQWDTCCRELQDLIDQTRAHIQ